MNSKDLRDLFLTQFDEVGIIHTDTYQREAKKLHKKLIDLNYPTMVVVALSYPKRYIKQTKTHLVPSFYTFGQDYHDVLKNRIKEVMKHIDYPYELGVDNHPYDERLAAVLSGVGFFGKNQLIINDKLGSYMFLGLVLIDCQLDEAFILDVEEDCKTCDICIKACPVQALEENKYHLQKCISYFNQEKTVLTESQIISNHSLFGCDICQMVCPKNINKGVIQHSEFELSGKELVSIKDLFELSNKAFDKKYQDMAYLWKGKTVLMRNALTVMLKQKNTAYIDLIEKSLHKKTASWYQDTAEHILDKLKKIKAT
jgi:epoxyqueuosine reductase